MCDFDMGNINSLLAQFLLKNDFFQREDPGKGMNGKVDSGKGLEAQGTVCGVGGGRFQLSS